MAFRENKEMSFRVAASIFILVTGGIYSAASAKSAAFQSIDDGRTIGASGWPDGRGCVLPDVSAEVVSPLGVNWGNTDLKGSDIKLIESYLGSFKPGTVDRSKKYLSSSYAHQNSALVCASAMRVVVDHCLKGSPALMGDMEVRVAWNCGQRTPYLLFFSISKRKIYYIWSVDKVPPPLIGR